MFLLLFIFFVYADQYAIIIDTSTSMITNDRDQVALLSSLMIADVLSSQDELIILPFDNQVQAPNEMARAPVLRRSSMPSSNNGTAAFMTEMRKNIVYDHTRTDFAPSIRQAVQEVVSTMNNHKNNTIILLTDGDPTDSLQEEIQFQKIVTQLQQYNNNTTSLQVWILGLGPNVDANNNVNTFFENIRMGGFVHVQSANDLLHGFGEILGNTSQRVVDVQKKYANTTALVEIEDGITRADIVLFSSYPGVTLRGSSPAGVFQDPSGARHSATGNDQVFGKVNAVHNHKGKTLKGKTRSYQRTRLKNPAVGKWKLKLQKTSSLMIIREYGVDVDLVVRTDAGTNAKDISFRIPMGGSICFDAITLSESNSNTPSLHLSGTHPIHNSFEPKLEIVESSSKVDFPNPPSLLDNGPNSSKGLQGDHTNGDGIYGGCWTPTSNEVFKTFDVQAKYYPANAPNTTSSLAESKSVKVEVVPQMILKPLPKTVVVNNGQKMATGETSNDCQDVAFVLQPPTSVYKREIGGNWEEKANFIVELGYKDPNTGKWVNEIPKNTPVSNISISLDGFEPNEVTISSAGSSHTTFLGWEVEWEEAQPEHKICVTMGKRSAGGRSTPKLQLKIRPKDPPYSKDPTIQAFVELDIDSEDPTFWEIYGPIVIVLTVMMAALGLVYYNFREPPFGSHLAVAIWDAKDGDPDIPKNAVTIGGLREKTFDEINLTIKKSKGDVVFLCPYEIMKRTDGTSLSNIWTTIGSEVVDIDVGITYRVDTGRQKYYVQITIATHTLG